MTSGQTSDRWSERAHRPCPPAPRLSRRGLDRPSPHERHPRTPGAIEVAAIADPSPTWRRRRGDWRRSAKLVSTLDDLLDAGVDGVVIATPSAMHAEQSIRALERGAAVFCQKPLGRTAAEVQAVVDAARAADRLLGVDLSYRFTEGMRRIREVVRIRGARAHLRGRSCLPQCLRTGQALVLRPGALGRRLRHGPRRPPGRPRLVDAGLPAGRQRLRQAVRGRRAAR